MSTHEFKINQQVWLLVARHKLNLCTKCGHGELGLDERYWEMCVDYNIVTDIHISEFKVRYKFRGNLNAYDEDNIFATKEEAIKECTRRNDYSERRRYERSSDGQP